MATTRPHVIEEVLSALASGDRFVVFDVLARCDPSHEEIAAAEGLLHLDAWLDRAASPWTSLPRRP